MGVQGGMGLNWVLAASGGCRGLGDARDAELAQDERETHDDDDDLARGWVFNPIRSLFFRRST